MRIGIIGGTGLYGLARDTESVRVETPWGPTSLEVGREPDAPELVFVNRHGPSHHTPPHRIDHRRHVHALATARVDAVIGVCNTGALRPEVTPGSLMVPDDLIDQSGRDDDTFFDDVVHIDLSTPFCPHVRAALLLAATDVGDTATDGGVYVAVRGPRLETPAEVRELARLGHVVGMTGYPEITLAREAGLCYAQLAVVANPAAKAGDTLAAEAIRAGFTARLDTVRALLANAAGRVPAKRDCPCPDAARVGRLAPVDPNRRRAD